MACADALTHSTRSRLLGRVGGCRRIVVQSSAILAPLLPILAPVFPVLASLFTPFLAIVATIFTALHARGLGLGLRYAEGRGHQRGSQAEKREGVRTREHIQIECLLMFDFSLSAFLPAMQNLTYARRPPRS